MKYQTERGKTSLQYPNRAVYATVPSAGVSYNLTTTELMNLQNSHVNAALERIFGETPVREKARQHAEQHVALLKTAEGDK